MAGSLIDPFFEWLPSVARGLGALIATVAGVGVEFNGLLDALASPSLVHLWMVGIGLLLLGVGYVLASELLDGRGDVR